MVQCRSSRSNLLHRRLLINERMAPLSTTALTMWSSTRHGTRHSRVRDRRITSISMSLSSSRTESSSSPWASLSRQPSGACPAVDSADDSPLSSVNPEEGRSTFTVVDMSAARATMVLGRSGLAGDGGCPFSSPSLKRFPQPRGVTQLQRLSKS